MNRVHVPGTLVLYAYEPPYAATVLDHVAALPRHSRYPAVAVNVRDGFPHALRRLEFDAIQLHYSLFGIVPYELDGPYLEYLAASAAYSIAFFQDEYRFSAERFAFVDRFDVDSVHTMVEPRYWDETWRRHTRVTRLEHELPGYVSDGARAAARTLARPDAKRTVDVGYRGRPLPYSLGRSSVEKDGIAREFARRARGTGLRLDVAGTHGERLYGRDWYAFLGNCRAVLGVEGGASAFDVEGTLLAIERDLRAREPEASFERYAEVAREALDRIDGRIHYLMVTPRHFEAAVFGCCQVLFEGTYSDVLQPNVHYLPLRKDFANFDDVVAQLQRPEVRIGLAAAARRDLVESGRYDYARLAERVDAELSEAGLTPREPAADAQHAVRRLAREQTLMACASAGRRTLARVRSGARTRARLLASRATAGAGA